MKIPRFPVILRETSTTRVHYAKPPPHKQTQHHHQSIVIAQPNPTTTINSPPPTITQPNLITTIKPNLLISNSLSHDGWASGAKVDIHLDLSRTGVGAARKADWTKGGHMHFLCGLGCGDGGGDGQGGGVSCTIHKSSVKRSRAEEDQGDCAQSSGLVACATKKARVGGGIDMVFEGTYDALGFNKKNNKFCEKYLETCWALIKVSHDSFGKVLGQKITYLDFMRTKYTIILHEYNEFQKYIFNL